MASEHELDFIEDDPRTGSNTPPAASPSRPSLQVFFACANAYQRVLRSFDGQSYTARCPKCGMVKHFLVGPGGSDQRTFRLSCE
ncbi:MAG: hypothetical protein RL689_895 [Planctomycetota bacterium]|jgi:hypothetical protein